MLAAVISALAFGALRATEYGARAEILYDAPASAPLDARERGLATQRAMILSRAVLAPAAKERKLSLEAVERAVSVELGTRNDLLYITAASTDRSAAVQLASAVTRSYLRLDAGMRADARGSRDALQHELDRLSIREGDATGREAAILRERIGQLMQQDAAGADRPTPRLLSSVYLLDDPLSPSPVRLAAAGLIVGSALAAALAFLLVRRRV